jgi:hypothetical protein
MYRLCSRTDVWQRYIGRWVGSDRESVGKDINCSSHAGRSMLERYVSTNMTGQVQYPSNHQSWALPLQVAVIRYSLLSE